MAAQVFTRLAHRWWPVAALVALGAAAGLGYALLRQPVYAAKAYVVVVAATKNSSDSTAVNFAQAYARIAGQGDVLVAATRNSSGQTSVQDLQRAVRATSSPDAPVIELTGSASTAQRAADLSNLVANALISTANQRSTDTRVRLVQLSPALPPTGPASPRPALDTAVGAAAGLLLGGLALLTRPGPIRSGMAPHMAPGGRFGAADGARMPEIQRWTGTAPVTVRTAPIKPLRRKEAGPNDGEDEEGTVDEDDGERTALAKVDGTGHGDGLKKH